MMDEDERGKVTHGCPVFFDAYFRGQCMRLFDASKNPWSDRLLKPATGDLSLGYVTCNNGLNEPILSSLAFFYKIFSALFLDYNSF